MINISAIGENIKRIRIEKGLTQQQLADYCTALMNNGKKMYSSAVRKYESGVVTPKFEVIQRIAAALGVSLSDLTNLNITYDINGSVDGVVGFEEDFKPLIESMGYHVCNIEENICVMLKTLNEDGLKKAFVRVSDIARNPEFQKDVTPCQDQQKTPDQSESVQTELGKDD